MSGEREFNAGEAANKLREAARSEMHGMEPHTQLFDEFSKIQAHQLNEVGNALEKGNAPGELTTAPQSSIKRDICGDVVSIEFHPGKLDFGKDPRSITLGKLETLANQKQ